MDIQKIKVKLNYINKLLGMNFSKKEVKKLLNKMGLDISKKSKNNELEILIPCYRSDIMHPMDIVEDIAIAYRYDKFKIIVTKRITFIKVPTYLGIAI